MSTKSRQIKKRTGYVPHQHEDAPKRHKGTGEVKNGKFTYEGDITVEELSKKLSIRPADIVKFFFLKGKITTMNTVLDDESIAEVCLENNIDFERKAPVDPTDFTAEEPDDPSKLVERPPVITVMGHVDHGKTTLIDRIRHSSVALGEAGGITQEIGAYQKDIKGKKITILDTPGHEAFTAMRARGAKIGDIAILVVAADDGVMPQTREAIDHARAAKLPIIVAINKCDKPGANPDRVLSELAGLGLNPEEWGGDTICCRISARTGEGVDNLLENVLTLAELLELKANPSRMAEGTVIEAGLDRREGAKATLLVQNGTLHVGDCIVVGTYFCKVRRMTNEYGKQLKSAGPSTPVSIIGLSGVPTAGDSFRAFADEKKAKEIAAARAAKSLAKSNAQGVTLANALSMMSEDSDEQVLNLVVKTDTQGTAEALKEAITKIAVPSVKTNLIRCATGEVTEGDVVLAEASHGLIITFNTRTSSLALDLAKQKKIEIRNYNIIYQLIDDITKAMKGLLKPTYKEVVYGHAEVRAVFKSNKAGSIAGCYVTDGKIPNGAQVRIVREQQVVETTKISSLKHIKDDIKEAATKTECGLTLCSNFKFTVGDVIEAFGLEEVRSD